MVKEIAGLLLRLVRGSLRGCTPPRCGIRTARHREDMRMIYNQPHKYYYGVDLHARSMFVGERVVVAALRPPLAASRRYMQKVAQRSRRPQSGLRPLPISCSPSPLRGGGWGEGSGVAASNPSPPAPLPAAGRGEKILAAREETDRISMKRSEDDADPIPARRDCLAPLAMSVTPLPEPSRGCVSRSAARRG